MKILGWEISKNGSAMGPEPSPITATWFDILLSLLGGTGDTINLGVDYARDVYQKLVTALVIMMGVIAWGFILNVYGYYGANIILATIFAVITAILWWRPDQVAWVGVAGAIIGELDRDDPKHGGLSSGAKWLIEKYASIFKMVTLVGTIVLFYLGIIPFGENPIAFFVIVSGSIVTGLLADRYKEQFEGTFAVEILFYGVCVIIALSVLSLIPAQSWGDKGSFGQMLMGNIKGGIFLFALLVTLIVTLSMKGFRKWALIFFGVMDLMFMPMNILWGHLPSWPWPGTGRAQANIQPTAQVAPQQTSRTQRTINGSATQGVFTEVRVPDGCKADWHCQPGGLVGIVHKNLPQGKIRSCEEDEENPIHFGEIQDIRLSFVSTVPEPKWYRVELVCN